MTQIVMIENLGNPEDIAMVRNQMQHDKAVTLETPSTNNFLQELISNQVD